MKDVQINMYLPQVNHREKKNELTTNDNIRFKLKVKNWYNLIPMLVV